jgi:hypothetical protein
MLFKWVREDQRKNTDKGRSEVKHQIKISRGAQYSNLNSRPYAC